MKARNLFLYVDEKWRRRLFLPSLFMAIGIMTIFFATGFSLNTELAPYGVVSFEVAGTVERVEAILDSWDLEDRIRVSFGLGLDFLFIPIYTLAIGFAVTATELILGRKKWPFASLGHFLSWGIIAAAMFDVIENIALIRILFNGNKSPLPQVAAGFAMMKFTLIFLCLVYGFFGFTVYIVNRRGGSLGWIIP